MLLRSTSFLLLFLSSTLVSAQQANIWHFGNGVGLDFSSGYPVEIEGGQTNHYLDSHTEGSACISDAEGNLLFYSNGNQIWNANHELMPNGSDLVGHHSSTQSALIIPVPGSQDKYYLVVTDSFMYEPQTGPHYYVVDMCLDNGLGDIDLNLGAQELHPEFTEKIAVTRHANGEDYWLVSHITLSNEFRAFHVSEAGFSSAVSSFTGSIHDGGATWNVESVAIGQMKISPDGSMLALGATNGVNFSELFTFDNSTGQVDFLLSVEQTFGGYGVAFSPDNSKLYLRNLAGLFQLDLAAGNADDILDSMVTIDHGGTNQHSGLQLGPDGRIYCSAYYNSSISAIHSPNEMYPDCDFELHFIELANEGLGYCFPSFMDSFDYPDMMADCSGTAIQEYESQSLIFPNPASDVIKLDLSQFGSQMIDIQIINNQGQSVYHGAAISSNRNVIPCSEFATGVYTVIVRDGHVELFSGAVKVE